MRSLSIQSRITILVLMAGFVMIMVNGWRNENWVIGRRFKRLERDAEATGSRLAGMLQHLTRKQQSHAAELEMAYASLTPEMDLGLVCDGNLAVRFSTELQWRGTQMQDTPLGTATPKIEEALRVMDNLVEWNPGREELLAVFPFFEGYDSKRKSAVVLRYNPHEAVAESVAAMRHESMIQGIILMALCLLLWFSLDELVILRVQKIVKMIRSVARGQRPTETLSGNDELAIISREFAGAVNQLRDAESQVLEAAEKVRRKIGRDLHDDLCQRLAGIKMKMEVLDGMTPRGGVKAEMLAHEMVHDLGETIDIARSLARGLSPVGLERNGLNDALEGVAIYLQKAYGVGCEVDCADLQGVLNGNAQEELFRIAQELAVNAVKHSKPGRMAIAVRLTDEEVILTVTHDGTPFDAKAAAAGKGMGLALMNQRLRILSATLERSAFDAPPQFSIASVHIPLNQ